MNKYILIKNGKINFKNLVNNKISIKKLFVKIKEKNIMHIEDIKYLYIYKNIYIFKIIKEPVSLVIDGKYIYSNMIFNNKNILWFNKIIKKYKIDIKSIKYAVYVKNKLFIIRYNN